MPTVPIKESSDTFGHLDANVPFAIESAVVDGGGNLDVTVGDGRISWGGTTYELSTGGTGTIVTEATIPAAVDDYYVVIDYAAGTPVLDIITTTPAANTDADLVYLGYVTTTATPTVDTITDLRSFQPSSGGWRGFDGSAATPTYSFADDPDTGIYLTATGQIAISTAGTQRAILSGTTLQVEVPVTGQSGSAAAPTYSFSGDPTSGIYRDGSGRVSTSVGGAQTLSVDGTRTRVHVGTIENTDGTVGAPSYTFTTDPDTGLYRSADNTLAAVTQGTARVTVNTATVTSTLPHRSPDGTSTAPTYSFTNDSDTGVYLQSTNVIGFTAGNTLTARIGSSAILPGTDGVETLGNASNRFERAYLKGGTSASDIVADFDQGYTLYSDNTGVGTDNTRLWMNTPDTGETIIGPRGGSSYLAHFRVRSDSLTVQDTNDSGHLPILIGSNDAFTGTPPAAGSAGAANFYVAAGYATGTTDASGFVTLTFDTAFPNGILSAVITSDADASPTRHGNVSTVTTSALTLRFFQTGSGGVLASDTVAFHYFVVGF